jgi:hypothetical protein
MALPCTGSAPESLEHAPQPFNKANPIARPRTREVIPRARCPNFRDAGRTVDAPLLKVLANLQKKHGEAFASEAGLRHMIAQDTGHMPGTDTIRRALERLEALGLVAQVWLKPGGILPDGGVCTYGTRLVHVPACHRDRRALRARARRDGETRRVHRRALAELGSARAQVAAILTPAPAPAVDFERRRRAQLEALAALERDGFPSSPSRPPD